MQHYQSQNQITIFNENINRYTTKLYRVFLQNNNSDYSEELFYLVLHLAEQDLYRVFF